VAPELTHRASEGTFALTDMSDAACQASHVIVLTCLSSLTGK